MGGLFNDSVAWKDRKSRSKIFRSFENRNFKNSADVNPPSFRPRAYTYAPGKFNLTPEPVTSTTGQGDVTFLDRLQVARCK